MKARTSGRPGGGAVLRAGVDAVRSRAGEIFVWLVAIIATPVVLTRWLDTGPVLLWCLAHTAAYWSYVLRPPSIESLRDRVIRMAASVAVWGSIPVSALIADRFERNETAILLVVVVFVSLRAIVPLGEQRDPWEADGLVVGTVAAIGSFIAGNPLFGVAAIAGALFYYLAERGQVALHDQARDDRWARELAMARMTALAYTDQLTALENRRAAIDWLADQSTGQGAVLLFDVDDFKLINDRYGHQFGDDVLVEVSAEIASRLDSSWTVYRLGGDEFIAFSMTPAQVLHEVFDGIAVEAAGFDDTVFELEIAVSAGWAPVRFPIGLDDAMELVAPALREAKRRHGSSVVAASRSATVDDPWGFSLRVLEALEARAFTWWGQPLVSLESGRPVGVELLCRWETGRGVAVPDEFMGVLQTFRRFDELGEQLIGEVPKWLESFAMHGLGDLRLHFNAPPSYVASGLVPHLERHLDRSLWPRLAIEVLESEVLNVNRSVIDALQRLRAAEAEVIIDDFGAGHSTLVYLTELPFDGVKLDRALLHDIDTHERRQAIVRGIAPVFAELGVETVAEGIENAGECDAVRACGVTVGQGWYFAEAQPLDACIATLLDLRDRSEVDSQLSR